MFAIFTIKVVVGPTFTSTVRFIKNKTNGKENECGPGSTSFGAVSAMTSGQWVFSWRRKCYRVPRLQFRTFIISSLSIIESLYMSQNVQHSLWVLCGCN